MSKKPEFPPPSSPEKLAKVVEKMGLSRPADFLDNADFAASAKLAKSLKKAGLTYGQVAAVLSWHGWPTRSGKGGWWNRNTKEAVEMSATEARQIVQQSKKSKRTIVIHIPHPDDDPTPPSGGRKTRKPSKTEKAPTTGKTVESSTTPEPSVVAMLPLTREPRKGLKRMLSKEEWEAMPSTVRRAVIEALADRLVGGNKR